MSQLTVAARWLSCSRHALTKDRQSTVPNPVQCWPVPRLLRHRTRMRRQGVPDSVQRSLATSSLCRIRSDRKRRRAEFGTANADSLPRAPKPAHCQKHQCTKITAFHLGRTMSGRPGILRTSSRKRKPICQRDLRIRSSGLVSRPLMRDMSAEGFSGDFTLNVVHPTLCHSNVEEILSIRIAESASERFDVELRCTHNVDTRRRRIRWPLPKMRSARRSSTKQRCQQKPRGREQA